MGKRLTKNDTCRSTRVTSSAWRQFDYDDQRLFYSDQEFKIDILNEDAMDNPGNVAMSLWDLCAHLKNDLHIKPIYWLTQYQTMVFQLRADDQGLNLIRSTNTEKV
jgi:hypothetical protein